MNRSLVLRPLGDDDDFRRELAAAIARGESTARFFDVVGPARVESTTPAAQVPACYFFKPSEAADAEDSDTLRRLGITWKGD